MTDLSPEHRDRLAALADLLETVPDDRFDMSWFHSRLGNGSPEGVAELRDECGTAGCALGWATTLFPSLGGEGWWDYVNRVFGLPVSEEAWSWMFSDWWRDWDNTPRGAAARIRHLLEHGLTEDWREQMSGEAPLCYDTQAVEVS